MRTVTCPSCHARSRTRARPGRLHQCPRCATPWTLEPARLRHVVEVESDEPDEGPSAVFTVLRTVGLIGGLLIVAGLAVVVIVAVLRKPAEPGNLAAVIPTETAEQKATREKADADRAAAERTAAARAEAARKVQADYVAFQTELRRWVKGARSVTLLMRSAPDPAFLHRRIRDAADKLAAVRQAAAGHFVNGDDGPLGKRGDVIGIIYAKADGLQEGLAMSEDLADTYISAMRSGAFQLVGPMGELIAKLGRTQDDLLDQIEDLVKGPTPPTMRQVDDAAERMRVITDRMDKVIQDAKRNGPER